MDVEKIFWQLTLEEKAALCSGQDFWHLKGFERFGIPPVMLTDGPHGLRKEVGGSGAVLTESAPATCFPTASCLASTWNRALLFRVGESIAEEAFEEGVSILLGPGANVKRSPLCGSNFEYFSEDPCLSGEMAKSWIDGAQSKGVGASLKHYAVNNQEHRRMTINADVDERALREIYLAGFERAVRGAQPWTVMGAYNRLNSIYCCEHDYLLNKLLRQEWGFEGLVVTDWGAMNNRVEALMAGCDLEMPGVPNGNTEIIIQAVHAGQLDESVLDETVRRILRLIEMSVSNMRSNFHYNRGAHHALAKEAAGEGAVLLKNEMNLLPLDTQAAVALIGAFARKPRYQGSGSSLMNPNQLDTLYDEMVRLAGKDKIEYAPGYDLESSEATPRLIEEALAAARKADYAVVSAGLPDMYEVEGVDRENMALPPGHNALIKAVAAANPRTIVVLSNGAPVEMPWLGCVSAVLEGYLGGQAGAGAAAEILYGYINPSGKLCETFPVNLEDNSSHAYFPGGPAQVEYRESVFVGYRFYDSVEKQVRFPFGHGLSFTTFEYSDLCCEPRTLNPGEDLAISLNVENTGSVKGKETIQIYVHCTSSTLPRPQKELKQFEKFTLEPGESREVSMILNCRDFAVFDPGTGEWVVESGDFDILVGASSRDIRMQDSITVRSDQKISAEYAEQIPDIYRKFPLDADISREDFERLLGRKVRQNKPAKKGEYTINTPILEMQGSLIGRVIKNTMDKQIRKIITGFEGTPMALMMEKMIEEAPLRMMLMAGGEKITMPVLEAILMMANGRWIRSLAALMKQRRKK